MSEQTASKQKLSGGQIAVFVTIMCMYFLAPTHSIINAVSADIMSIYNVDANAVAYLVSITNLLEIPAAFVVGLVAGRAVSYRACAIFSMLFEVIGGLPALLGASLPWWGLMVTRCLLGLGLGCIMPIVLSIIALVFQNENTRATMMSIANIIFSIGMISLTSIGGILGAMKWNYIWAVYLVAMIPLVLAIFTLGPKNVPQAPAKDSKGEKVKIKLPASGWGLLVLFLCGIIMSQSLFNLGGATIASVVNNPAVIGTIFSCFSVGAIICAVAFSPCYRVLGAQTVTLFWAIGMVGYILWLVAHLTGSVTLFYVAIILAGFGTNSMTIGVPMNLSTIVPPAVYAAVMGFSYVFQNGGGFIATPIDQIVSIIGGANAIMSSVWIFDIILGIIIFIVLFFVSRKVNKQRKEVANADVDVK